MNHINSFVRKILLEGRGEFIFNRIWSFVLGLIPQEKYSTFSQPSKGPAGVASKWKNVKHQSFVMIDFYDVPEKSVEIFYDKLKEEYPRLIEKDFGSTHHYLYNFIRSFEIWIALKAPRGASGTYYGSANREGKDVSKRAASFKNNIFMTAAVSHLQRSSLPKSASAAAMMLKRDKTATHEFGHGVQTAIWDASPSAKEGTEEGKKGKHTQQSKKFILLSNMELSPGVREYYEWLGPMLEELDGDPIRPVTIGDGLAFALNKAKFTTENSWSNQGKFAKFVEKVIPMKNAVLIDTDKIPPKALRLLKQKNIVKAKETPSSEETIGWKKHQYGRFHPISAYLTEVPVKHQSQEMKDALEDAVGNVDDWILAIMAPGSAVSSGQYGDVVTPPAENKAKGYGTQKTIPKHKTRKTPRHRDTQPYSFRKKRGANVADVEYNIGYTSKGGSSNTGDKWNRQPTEFDAEFKSKSREFMKEMAEHGISYAVGAFNYQNMLIALMEENVSAVSKLLQTKSGVLDMFKTASNLWKTDVLNHPSWNYKKKANDRFEIYAEVLIDAMMDDEVQDEFDKVTGFETQGSVRSTADFIVRYKRANPFRQKLDEVLGQKLKKLLGL